MTTLETLLKQVEELDAKASAAKEQGDFEYAMFHLAYAAPILARICLKLIEQRDGWHGLYHDGDCIPSECILQDIAELDRIAKGEE